MSDGKIRQKLTARERAAFNFFMQRHLQQIGDVGSLTYDSATHAGGISSAMLWANYAARYYVGLDQEKLIRRRVKRICNILGDFDVAVDFGCGDAHVVSRQIVPILAETACRSPEKKHFYIPNDLSKKFAYEAAEKVKKRFAPAVFEARPWVGSYLDTSHKLPEGRKVGFWFGSSLNFPNLVEGLATRFAAFRKILGPDGMLVAVFDSNMDPEKVKQSYDDPIHHAQEIALIRNLKTKLKIGPGLDPDAWFYQPGTMHVPIPFADAGVNFNALAGIHVLRPMEHQAFFIKDRYVAIEEREGLISDWSWKIQLDFHAYVAKTQLFDLHDVISDPETTLLAPIYKGMP